MSGFKCKMFRCEWQIVNQPVGQYDENNGEATVLWSWPTYEEALADRSNHGYEHEFVKDRWIPNEAGEYEMLEIRYKEVLVSYDKG